MPAHGRRCHGSGPGHPPKTLHLVNDSTVDRLRVRAVCSKSAAPRRSLNTIASMATDFEDDLLAADDQFQARIDDLVSSALEDQAREKRFLMEMVSAAKAALTKAEHELTSLRQVVEHRDVAVVDLLEARLSGLGTERSIEDLAAKINMMLERPPVDELVLPITERIAELADQVARVQSGLKPLDPWPAALEIQRMIADRVEARLKPLSDDVSEARRETLEVVRAVAEEISERISHRMNAAEEALAGDVDVMQEAVVQRMDAGLDRTSTAITEKLGEAVDHLSSGFESGVTEIKDKLEALHERTAENVTGSVADLAAKSEGSIAELASRSEESISTLQSQLIEIHQSSTARVFDRMQQIEAEIARITLGVAEIPTTIETGLAELQTFTAQREHDLREAIHAFGGTIAEGEQQRSEVLGEQIGRISSTIDSYRPVVSRAIHDAMTPFAEEVRALGERVRQTNRRITESNSRLEAMHESLIAYLSMRDERLEIVREKSVVDMFDQLEEALNAKERAKLAGSMKLSRQRRQDRRDAERYRKMMAESRPVTEAERELVLEEMTQARLASKEATKEVAALAVSPPPKQPKTSVTAANAKKEPKKSAGKTNVPAPKPRRKRAV